MYAITATVEVDKLNGWTSTRQVPTFYLDERVQGIGSEDAARQIAQDILTSVLGVQPPGVRCHITAVKV
jgi:hypothetical protein